jgi:hypothetical protein
MHLLYLNGVFGTFLEIYSLNVLNELSAMEGCGGLDRISSGNDLSSFHVGEQAREKFQIMFVRHRTAGVLLAFAMFSTPARLVNRSFSSGLR